MHKKQDIVNMTKFQVSNMFKLNEFQDQAFKQLHKIHTNKATIKIWLGMSMVQQELEKHNLLKLSKNISIKCGSIYIKCWCTHNKCCNVNKWFKYNPLLIGLLVDKQSTHIK
jgi:hypothetical protein